MKRLLSSLMLLFLPVLAAPAVTWYVSTNGSDTTYTGTNAWTNAFLSITNAVVKSSAGDLILVSNGTYYAAGPGTVSSGTNFIYINKAITLKSFSGNPEDTILHGNGMTNRVVMMYAKGSVLDGFTLTNGYPGGYSGGGLVVFDSALITNCIITGCRSDNAGYYGAGGGVYLGGAAGNGVITMAWCRVIGNAAMYTFNVQAGGGGIYCQTNSTVSMIISNCDIGYNTIGAGEGGGICGSRNVRIYNSHIFGNMIYSNAGLTYGGGGVGWHYGGPYLKDCFISNNVCSNSAGNNQGGGTKNCILDHCAVLNNTGYYGGGVYGGVVSNDSLVAGNYGLYAGGGLYSVAAAYDSVISNNYNSGYYGGGGAYFGSVSGVISNCLIIDNFAVNAGGGVSCYYLDYANNQQVINCRIIGNRANNKGGGMFVTLNYGGGTSVVQNCLFANNVATNGGGYYAEVVHESRVISSTFVSNRAMTAGGGVYAYHSFSNCIIASNTAGSYADLWGNYTNNFWYCCVPSRLLPPGQGNTTADPGFIDYPGGNYHLAAESPCINAGTNQPWMGLAYDLDSTNSRIINGRTDIGCYEYANGTLSVTFGADRTWALAPSTNIFTALASGTNTTGLYYIWDFTADGTPDLEGSDLAVVTNTYAAPGYYSVALTVTNAAGESASLTNLNYLKVGPMTYYVATNGTCQIPYTNWAMAMTSLYAATRMANDGDTVLVSNGVFFAWSPRSFIDVNQDMTIRSLNGPAYTSVTRTPGINSRVFVISSPRAALVGLTITNGFTTGPYGYPLFAYGGGVYMTGGMISNCVIARNTVTNGGGGIYMTGGLVVNSVIRDNLCSNDGAGIMIGNYGAVRNCLIVSNRVTAGVAPTALRGGGIYFSAGGTAENCTVVGNLASNVGGGVFCVNGGRVLNSIIVSNSTLSGLSSNWYTNGSAAISFSNCCVIPTNDLTGTGHIQAEPLFVDYANDNFRLGAGSPCVDTGTNQAYWMPAGIDLDGIPRIRNGIVDRGAYEYDFYGPTNVAASDGAYADKIEITWETVTQAQGYSIWRSQTNTTNTAACLGAAQASPYADITASTGVLYYYWVQATNALAPTNSLFGPSDSGYIQDPAAPAPPSNVAASVAAWTDRIEITWSTNSDAAGYAVWRHATNDAAFAVQLGRVEDVTVGVYTDAAVPAAGTFYYYWVAATNASRSSVFSAPAAAGARALMPATNVIASKGLYTNQVTVIWQTNQCTNAAGYLVWRNAGSDSLASAQVIGSATGTNYTDTAVTTNIQYFYWIEPTNAISATTNSCSLPDWGYCAMTYYVATNGTDTNAGVDWATSLATISNGLAKAQRWLGGGVIISNGVYQSGGIVADNGTNMVYITNGITVKGFSGTPADVIVDGGGSNRCFWVYHNGAVVADLTLQGGHTWGGTVGGGGLLLYAGLVTNCVITNNIANTGGGGIYGETGGVISNCVVAWNMATNTASGYGGGIRVAGASWVIRDCPSIYNNRGTQQGGGMYLSGASVISNCVFSNNFVIYSGAGIGGGLYLDSSARVTHSLITSNAAVAYNGRGGGVYLANSALVTNCTIFTNKAYWGGGIYGSGYVRNCTNISYNVAVFSVGTLARGGALYLTGGTVADCIISNNVAGARGGGLTTVYANGLLISNCVFDGNYASDEGGGIEANQSGVNLRNCLITRNVTAGYGGGADLYGYQASTPSWLENCTIVSNRAAYGGGLRINYTNVVINTIIYSNSASSGGADVKTNIGGMTFTNCCISDTNGLVGEGNLTNYPQFREPAAGNWRLASGSLCINRGLYEDWMAGALDKDGNARILGGTVDLGAYEYPLYPQVSPLGITNTLVSGVGTGTLVEVWSGDTNAELIYAASSTNDWIGLGVSNGVIAVNTTNALWVTNSAAGLAPGVYTGQVYVISTNSLSALYPPDTQTVTVIMTVLPLEPPANVQATDGAYADKVVVTWETNLCTNATGYAVWRSISADTNSASILSAASDTSYIDTSAANGVLYYYWVQATNAYAVSDLSASNTGWRAIVPPTGVSASDGTVTGKIVVTWETNVCTNATGYYVWRNDSNDAASALNLGGTAGTNYDDTTAISNTTYYYWVQATNAAGPGGTNSFSAPDTGCWAQWYYVATNGDDNASGIDWGAPLLTVSNGVMRAQRWAGGGVLVSNGEYTLAATNIFITNAITVRSWNNGALDAAGTVVDGNLATRCFRISHGSAVVDSLTIRNGTNAVSGGGVYLENGAQLLNCIVSSNYAPDGAGIYVADGTVMGCAIQYNLAFTNQSLEPALAPSRGGGVFLYRNGTISNCVIAGNLVSNTYVSGANYSGGGGIGIHTVASGDRCRVYSSLISNNFSWSAGGGISWRAQQEGLDQILIQSCTNVNNEALGSGGGFACYSPGTGGTINGGVIMANVATNGWGGGIYVLSGLGPRVGDSLIRGNKAFSGGGAASVSLFNCTVESNTCYSTSYAGGGIYLPAARLVVSNCVIRGNRSEGVGNVRGGAGIELVGGLGGNNLVVDCRIYDNYSANYGGGVHCRANNSGLHTQLLYNCVVYGNVAVRGGGIFLNTTGAMVSACTIVSNRASGYGGGMYLANGYATNCVIYSNDCATAGWKDLYAAAAGLTNNLGYCCISTNIESGLHNITNEPVFLNFAAQNYRLAAGSAGINIGTNQDWMWWATDKDGNPRVLGGIADLGAYEYPLYPQVSPLGITNTLISGFSTSALVQLWSGDTNVDLNYAASSTNAWIALGVSNGVIAANMTNTLWVTNDSTGLAAGTYTGAVLVVATNSLSALYPPDTQTVTVIMTILPMGPPANVQATDGAYADKVVVTWETNLCTNATGYAVWRSISADTNSASILSAASDTSYIDTSAANGVLYYYWVQATNADCFSDLSESNTGYRALAPPTGITASDGTYTGKVVVTWQTNMCTNAVGYSVWRNTADDLTSATRLVGVAGTNYDDTSAASNILYYYWVQATNTLSQTNVSAGGPDSGYWALTYYVATNGSDANPGLDWTAPAASISNAVIRLQRCTCAGGMVFVSNGTYALTAQVSVTSNITVRSWYDGELDRTNTVVDGQRLCRGFYLNSSTALVAGFTIRNGSNTFGGGVYINSSGGTVSNCIIADNIVDKGGYYELGGGGGVMMKGKFAVVRDCVIQRNKRFVADGYSGGGGVFIQNGGLLKDCEISGNTNSGVSGVHGGGVYVYQGGTVDHCQVIGNVSPDGGYWGGMKLYNNNGAILITNCTVAGNIAGVYGGLGGAYDSKGTIIADCLISNNVETGDGAGGLTVGAYCLVQNCQIVNNRGVGSSGGILCSGSATVTACVVRGNYPHGVRSDNSAANDWRLVNCLIIGNTNYGVRVYNGTPGLVNCTIAFNKTGIYDSGVTTARVVNTVSYFNSTANYSGAALVFTNSCTTPLPPLGAGNFTDDPAFVNTNAANFRLQPGSACINAGTNDVWMDTAFDLQGRPRIRYGRVDVGCYEYYLNVKVNGVPMDRILRLNGVNQSRIFKISE